MQASGNEHSRCVQRRDVRGRAAGVQIHRYTVIALGLDGGASALQEITGRSMAATVAFDFNVMAVEGVNLAIGVASGEYTDREFSSDYPNHNP